MEPHHAHAPDTGVGHLTARHLHLVVAIEESGDIAAAGRAVGLSAAAAVVQLSRIESRLGTLFEPIGGRLTCTTTGERVVTDALALLRSVSHLETELENLRTGGRLLVWAAVLPFEMWLPALRQRLPGFVWNVRATTAAHAMAAVAGGDGELFCGLRRIDDPARVEPPPGDVTVTDILHEPAWVRLPANHPAALQDVVDLRDLADEVWAVLPDPDLEDGLVGAARRAGFEADIRFRPTDPAMKDQLAASGEALSLTSPLVDVADGVVLRRCRGGPVYAWVLAHRSGALPDGVVDGIVEVVRAAYREQAEHAPALRVAPGPGAAG